MSLYNCSMHDKIPAGIALLELTEACLHCFWDLPLFQILGAEKFEDFDGVERGSIKQQAFYITLIHLGPGASSYGW